MENSMQRWQAWLAAVTGALLTAAACMHALAGWPIFSDLLAAAHVEPDAIEGLRISWYLGPVDIQFGRCVQSKKRAG